MSVRPSVCGVTGLPGCYELKGSEQDFQCSRTDTIYNGSVAGPVGIVTEELRVVSQSLCRGHDTNVFFVQLAIQNCEPLCHAIRLSLKLQNFGCGQRGYINNDM